MLFNFLLSYTSILEVGCALSRTYGTPDSWSNLRYSYLLSPFLTSIVALRAVRYGPVVLLLCDPHNNSQPIMIEALRSERQSRAGLRASEAALSPNSSVPLQH